MAVSLLCSATALKQVWSREPAAEIAQAGTASASEKKNTALELYVCAQTSVMIKSQDLHQMYEAIALFFLQITMFRVGTAEVLLQQLHWFYKVDLEG